MRRTRTEPSNAVVKRQHLLARFGGVVKCLFFSPTLSPFDDKDGKFIWRAEPLAVLDSSRAGWLAGWLAVRIVVVVVVVLVPPEKCAGS